MYKHCGYLRAALEKHERAKTIKTIVARLKKLQNNGSLRYDAIAFTGLSGGLIAPVVADKLNKEIICVRKQTEKAHSRMAAEGWLPDNLRYIIIDDLTCSFDTVRNIVKAINPYQDSGIQCVGIYLYLGVSNGDRDNLMREFGIPCLVELPPQD